MGKSWLQLNLYIIYFINLERKYHQIKHIHMLWKIGNHEHVKVINTKKKKNEEVLSHMRLVIL